MTPLEGALSPARILSRVDLPAPFLPMRAILSLSLITKEMFSNNTVPPNSTLNPSQETILFFF